MISSVKTQDSNIIIGRVVTPQGDALDSVLMIPALGKPLYTDIDGNFRFSAVGKQEEIIFQYLGNEDLLMTVNID